ncbi:MAG: hypothetical protein ACOX9R_09095 [Armatimonadota bacterium]|jgi:hypothetical protein
MALSLLLLALMPAAKDALAAEPHALVSAGGLGGLLSAPLPGTRARDDAQLAASLERALVGFDGVERATVIISRSPEAVASSLHVALQLTLAPDFAPTPAWVETLCGFVLRIIPHLDRGGLTIVESTGRTLYDAGDTRLPPAPTPAIGVIDETFHFEPWWLWAAAGAGFTLVIAGAAVQRFARRDPAPEAVVATPGPLDFLEAVPVEHVAGVLADERREVVGAVLALAPEPVAAALRDQMAERPGVPIAPEHPDPRMTAALATALRGRLMTG